MTTEARRSTSLLKEISDCNGRKRSNRDHVTEAGRCHLYDITETHQSVLNGKELNFSVHISISHTRGHELAAIPSNKLDSLSGR